MRIEVERSPSNVTTCSAYQCDKKLLKGEIRVKEQIGEFNGFPRWRYFCAECGNEELGYWIERIQELQNKLWSMMRTQQRQQHNTQAENHVNNGGNQRGQT